MKTFSRSVVSLASLTSVCLALTTCLFAQQVYPDPQHANEYGDGWSFHFFSYPQQHIQLIYGDDVYPGTTFSVSGMDFRNSKFDRSSGSDRSRTFNAEIHMDHHDWSNLSPTFTVNFASGAPTLVHTAVSSWGDIVPPPAWTHDWGDREDLIRDFTDDGELSIPFTNGPFVFDSSANPGLGIVTDFQIRLGSVFDPTWTGRDDYFLDGMQFGPQPNDWNEGKSGSANAPCFRQGFFQHTWCEVEIRSYATFPWVDPTRAGQYVLDFDSGNLPPTTLTGPTLLALSRGFVAGGIDPVGTSWADSCDDIYIDPTLIFFAASMTVLNGGQLSWDPLSMDGHAPYDPQFLGSVMSSQASYTDIGGISQLSGAGWSTATVPPVVARMARNYVPNTRVNNPTSHTSSGSAFLFYSNVPLQRLW